MGHIWTIKRSLVCYDGWWTTFMLPLVINVFARSLEFLWVRIALLFLPICFYSFMNINGLTNRGKLNIKFFKNCGRYIDDLLMVNNNKRLTEQMCSIYPKELELVPDDGDGTTAPFLDLFLTVDRGVVFSSVYDKRDNFDFPIVNFPTLIGNIPKKSSYGVFVGELVRY